MTYRSICSGHFVARPNRFIAQVEINGCIEICHVKNTGRCKELLVPGATVYLESSDNPVRKTRYSIVAVEKGDRLINMDSQAPNKAVGEWLSAGQFLPDITKIKPESFYGHSRFDFYFETSAGPAYMEVKGVTLEENGTALFPDAPTDRGIKHLYSLTEAAQNGFCAYVLFLIQMEQVSYFTPNLKTHAAFGEALAYAAASGVQVLAYDCKVTKNSIQVHQPVPVYLTPPG